MGEGTTIALTLCPRFALLCPLDPVPTLLYLCSCSALPLIEFDPIELNTPWPPSRSALR